MSVGELDSDPDSTRPEALRRFVWTSVAVFVALTVIFFWRYALAPATTVSDHGDPLLLIWIMEWVERALVHSPRELFDAPMFRPFAETLAYSDPLLPQSVIALPLRLLGIGPIAAYNIVYLGSIAATGVAAAFLFFELTEDRTAALLGAAVATFPGLRLFHLAHMQLQFTTFLPLALLLVHRVIQRPGLGHTLLLAAILVAAPLASLYHGLFLAVLLPPFALTLWLTRRERTWAAMGHLALAGYIAACSLLPFARVYRRAILHLKMERSDRNFSDVWDYFSVSPFADITNALHFRSAGGSGSEWVGGGGALLLPIGAVAVIVLIVRNRGHFERLPEWARRSLPYVVLGCLAVALTLGPDVHVGGRVLFGNPLGYVSRLPGAHEIRDFQRAGFLVALAGGAMVAVGLAELGHRRLRYWTTAATGFVAISTAAPAFSTSLPTYRPPGPRAVYSWLEDQTEPIVVFEVPLPKRGALESLDYLYAAVHHKKALVHGFSGYLPLTDAALRREVGSVYRPDFFRALAELGATHLVVHTEDLAALPNGAAILANLRDARGDDLVARFADGEVYRVRHPPPESIEKARGSLQEPLFSSGAWTDPNRDCLEVGAPSKPLSMYVPQSDVLGGLDFAAESSLCEVDDAVVVERSADLKSWERVSHAPLLSTTLASYVEKPTQVLWSELVMPPGPGSFLRVSSGRRRLRLCGLSVRSEESRRVETVSGGAFAVAASLREETAKLLNDGKRRTEWQSGAAQSGNEWIDVDLGKEREVAAVVLDLGESAYDYGRGLALDCGTARDALDRGPDLRGEDLIFNRPHPVQILPFPVPRRCKVLRIRQTGQATENYWSVAEIGVLESSSIRPSDAGTSGDRPR